MAAGLISDLHAYLLRELSAKAQVHFQGLSQASRSKALSLTTAQKRTLQHLDVAHNFCRHITLPKCEATKREFAEVSTTLSPAQRPTPVVVALDELVREPPVRAISEPTLSGAQVDAPRGLVLSPPPTLASPEGHEPQSSEGTSAVLESPAGTPTYPLDTESDSRPYHETNCNPEECLPSLTHEDYCDSEASYLCDFSGCPNCDDCVPFWAPLKPILEKSFDLWRMHTKQTQTTTRQLQGGQDQNYQEDQETNFFRQAADQLSRLSQGRSSSEPLTRPGELPFQTGINLYSVPIPGENYPRRRKKKVFRYR